MTKQSQKNIQIVKVQVGDIRKKRKPKRKTKGKSKVFSGTGLAPVLGQPQYNYPPFAPMTSRAGTQFEPPRLQVVEKKEEPLKDEYVQSLDQLKKLQEYMKGKGEAPSPYNVPSEVPSPFEAGNYWTVPRFSDTPPQPLVKPQQPLVSAQASSSQELPFTRANLRQLTFKQLDKIRKQLGLPLPEALPSTKNDGLTLKEGLIEIIVGYRPSF
jgi:hypothetical protein